MAAGHCHRGPPGRQAVPTGPLLGARQRHRGPSSVPGSARGAPPSRHHHRSLAPGARPRSGNHSAPKSSAAGSDPKPHPSGQRLSDEGRKARSRNQPPAPPPQSNTHLGRELFGSRRPPAALGSCLLAFSPGLFQKPPKTTEGSSSSGAAPGAKLQARIAADLTRHPLSFIPKPVLF